MTIISDSVLIEHRWFKQKKEFWYVPLIQWNSKITSKQG